MNYPACCLIKIKFFKKNAQFFAIFYWSLKRLDKILLTRTAGWHSSVLNQHHPGHRTRSGELNKASLAGWQYFISKQKILFGLKIYQDEYCNYVVKGIDSKKTPTVRLRFENSPRKFIYFFRYSQSGKLWAKGQETNWWKNLISIFLFLVASLT